jgi:hypothetical protein
MRALRLMKPSRQPASIAVTAPAGAACDSACAMRSSSEALSKGLVR